MRINKLEFAAVGPFPDSHTIDFDLLGDSALFLIDGPTGAGKSTIIDAITYAIYGEMAGSSSDKTRIRSAHASANIDTWVRLTFSTQAGTYRVKRSPEYLRPAKKGDGSVKQAQTIFVEEQLPNGSWKDLAFQWVEAGKKLSEAVGLTRAQFAQTVVLPQGEFASFLRAETAERQPLLEQIFSTHVYSSVLVNLKERAKVASGDAKAATSGLDAKLNELKGSANLDSEILAELLVLARNSDDDAASIDLLKTGLSELKATADRAAANLANVKAKNDELLSTLSLRKVEHIALDNSSLAEQAVATTKLELKECLVSIETSVNLAELSLLKLSPSSKGFKWAEASNKVSSKAGQLEKISKLEKELPLEKKELRESEEELIASKAALGALRVAVRTTYPKNITSIQKALDSARKTAQKAELYEAKSEKLAAELKAFSDYDALMKTQQTLSKKTRELVAAAKAQVGAYDTLFKSRMDNLAGVLASQLKKGQPCSVCGAKEHPNKAKSHSGAASEQEVIDAAELVEQKRSAAEAAKSAEDKMKGTLDGAKAKLTREKSTVIAEKKLNEKALAASLAKLQVVEDLTEELGELQEELDEQNSLLEESSEKHIGLKAQTAELKKTILNSESLIKQEILKYNSILERVEALENLAEMLLSIEQAHQKAKTAEELSIKQKAELDKLPKHEDFGQIGNAEIELHEHKATYDNAVAQGASTSATAGALMKGIKEIKSLQDARRQVSGDSKAIIDLAKWADGANNLSQKLPSFVLQAMFEEVVDAANSRFSSILEGRYELRIPESEPGVKTGKGSKGLDLVVRDRLTESDRKPSTLSGGEQFCAALSLALGLSDIVLSNNSGLSIDTFFIDEGFGSLDSDRLSQVMQMLDRLKADGRTIGLISHVDEMKAAIAEHVDVKPIGSSGKSTISVSWMGS